jgi:hypothetical protein
MAGETPVVSQNPVWNPDYTALTYDAMQAETISYVRSRYEQEGIQDDYLQTNAAVMSIDVQSYIGSLIAQREDDNVHEVWLQNAVLRENALKTVRTLGQRPLLPRGAKIPVQLVFEETPNVDIQMNALYAISVKGLDGSNLQFEAMTEKGDYYSSITLTAGATQHKVYFYEGITYQDVFQSTGATRQEYKLRNRPVIEGSVYISCSPIPSNVIANEDLIASRITQVENLITPLEEIVFYMDVTSQNEVVVKFATDQFGLVPPRGWYIYVDYRVGGGKRGNIPVGAINKTINIKDELGTNRRVVIANTQSGGIGGENEESLEQIAARVPATVASAKKMDQRADYEVVLKRLLPNSIERVFVLDYQTALRLNRNNPLVPQNGVYLWILPLNSDVLDEEEKEIIRTGIEELNLIAVEHYLFDPDYVDWRLHARLYVDETVDQTRSDKAIRTALLAEFGKYDIDGTPTKQLQFSRRINQSRLIEILQKYIGDFMGTQNRVELVEPTADIDPYASSTSRYGEILRLDNANIYLEFILRERQ